MSWCINDLEIIGPYGERISVFEDLGAVKKFCILLIVLPPCGPIVIGIDKIFSDFVQCNVTTGFFLNEFISADMVAVGVSADNQLNIK